MNPIRSRLIVAGYCQSNAEAFAGLCFVMNSMHACSAYFTRLGGTQETVCNIVNKMLVTSSPVPSLIEYLGCEEYVICFVETTEICLNDASKFG